MKIAVCPGSFDPITVGHLDVVERAAALFDEVVVCVMINGEKQPLLSPEQRLEIVRQAISHLPNVRAESYGGLLADFVCREGACAVVKGVRGTADLDGEYAMAQINRELLPQLETVLLPARAEVAFVSSTMVRELLRHGRDVAAYVPTGSAQLLKMLFERKGQEKNG